MNKAIYILLAGASLVPTMPSTAKNRNVLDIKTEITDSNIIFPESYETDTRKMMEGWYMKNYTATDDRYRRLSDVNVSDDVIRDRLAKLPTVIEMPYNSIVRSYIERYTARGREQVAALLGLSLYYMPIFEQALEENNLPLELKYLPVIESGLDPNAVSRHGATGLWQFMIGTAKGLGMEVSSLVDERRDPYVASQAAAKYLKDLYATYGDWSLAIAAYNCGPGNVNKALRRAGGDATNKDFWSIYHYLSPETRGYVPMFIAANYVMNYYPQHNISPVLPTKPLVTDTLMIRDRVHFDQISHVLDIPVEELRVLNPQFRADIIPGSAERQYTLVLPSQQCHAYLMSEEDIQEYEKEKYARRLTVEPGDEPNAQLAAEIAGEAPVEDNTLPTLQAKPVETNSSNSAGSTTEVSALHKVEPGQTLSSIARMYEVTPDQIKQWNSLTRNAVRTGQMLRIHTTRSLAQSNNARDITPLGQQPAQRASAQTSPKASKWSEQRDDSRQSSKTRNSRNSRKSKTSAKAEPKSHTVKSGDNLSVIAKRYGTTVDALKKANGIKGSGDELHPGDNIKLPSSAKKSGSKVSSSKKKGRSSKSSGKRRRR